METIMLNPRQYKVPDYFLNRQKDAKDGTFTQVISNGLETKLREDLERMKKVGQSTAVTSSSDDSSSTLDPMPPWSSTLLDAPSPRTAHQDHWSTWPNRRCLQEEVNLLRSASHTVSIINHQETDTCLIAFSFSMSDKNEISLEDEVLDKVVKYRWLLSVLLGPIWGCVGLTGLFGIALYGIVITMFSLSIVRKSG
jgi:hypothetical protein